MGAINRDAFADAVSSAMLEQAKADRTALGPHFGLLTAITAGLSTPARQIFDGLDRADRRAASVDAIADDLDKRLTVLYGYFGST